MKNFYERDYLDGEPAVYPGHPVVIAYLIMNRFASLEEATTTEPGATYNRALGSHDIPGAGGEVHMALNLLRKCLVQERSSEEVVDEYAAYWHQYKAGGHEKYVEAGHAQLLKVRDKFLQQIQNWPKEAEKEDNI